MTENDGENDGGAGFDSSNPHDVAEKKKKSKLSKTNKINILAKILETKEGRKWCWELLSRTGVFQVSMRGDGAEWTAFREGQRNIGLMIQADIVKADATKYILMIQEAES